MHFLACCTRRSQFESITLTALAWSGFHSRSDPASKYNGESFPLQDTSKFVCLFSSKQCSRASSMEARMEIYFFFFKVAKIN